MTKTETECGACGAHIKKASGGAGARLALLLNMALCLSAAVTVATLFLPGLPSFSKLLPITIVLLMVRGSADQMIDTGR
jgi:hypothetical protein